jgi:hypothetical protein
VCGRQLLGEERIALAAAKDLVDQRRRCRNAEGRGGVPGDSVAVQSAESDSFDAAEPAELRDASPQGGVPRHLIGAIRANEDDSLVDEIPGQVLEHIPGAWITPVEIIEGDDDRCLGAQFTEKFKRQREDVPPAATLGGRELDELPEGRQRLRFTASLNLSDQVDERSERDGVTADVQAAAGEQVGARPSGSFGQQRGLADAGISAQQQGGWFTRCRETDGAFEESELVVASDDRLVLSLTWHRWSKYRGRDLDCAHEI